MSTRDLIQRRRLQVEEEIFQHEQAIGILKVEIDELDAAERVIARLGSGSVAQSAVGQDTPLVLKTPPVMTMPEMITNVLETARGSGLRGMPPKAIAIQIAKFLSPGVRTENVSSIAWRMWKRGQLLKDGATYMLPSKEKVADLKSSADRSATLFPNQPADGRKAGPGGGT